MAAPNGTGVASDPQAQAQLNGILADDADKSGVAVHTFDPDASPEEKAAAAGQARDQLKPINEKENDAGGQEIPLDVGASDVTPTITIEDTDKQKLDEKTQDEKPSDEPVPGAMPAGRAPEIPDWFKIGWRSVSGIDETPQDEGVEKEKLLLQRFISEQYYGDWYHNAALIVFTVIITHFLTRFNFGWGWLIIVLAFCCTYYSTSMDRVRRRARDDVQRELVKTRLASEHETADWMNNFLDRFWLIYEPVLSQSIVASVDQVLSYSTPAFLDSIRLSTFTLGTKAPRIDKVRTFPKTDEETVMMDWGISFTPNDVSDMTPNQVTKKVNPKIVLSVRVGKGLATAAMPILLEDITFSGLMRIRMKLMTTFPHVQLVDISFLEKPHIDYVLKPIGGETFGFDIGNIPGLSAFIRDMVHATLGPMMYEPNYFTLNLEQLLSGVPLDTAIGVIQVTIQSARGIKGTKIGGGTPDPYVALSINGRGQLGKTKYKRNTYNPSWMETKFLLVNSLSDTLVLTLFDWNERRKDNELGAASFELAKLQDDATQEGLETELLRDGKERGTLRYDVSFYPVLKPETVDGQEVLPDSKVGIVRLTLHQAKDLDGSKSMSGDLNPFAKVFLGNNKQPVHTTVKFKHTLSPVWESPTEFLCSDRKKSVITVKVVDDRDFMKDPVVGYLSVKLEDLLKSKKEAGKDWWPLSGCTSGRIRLTADWKPLDLAGSLHGADQYVPPIGVVRLWLQKATDVKNVEATLGGKSDPYVRVQINNVTLARTEVVNNNLNPEWDQIVYVPVHTLKESLLLECMDYQNLTKDRSLGSVELRVADLARDAPEDPRYPYAATGKKEAVDPIKLDRGNHYKGYLHYVAEFIPALAIKGVSFESRANELAPVSGSYRGDDDTGTVYSDGASSSESSSDEEAQTIPPGITVTSPVGFEFSPGHTRGAQSTDTTRTAATTRTMDTGKSKATTHSRRSRKSQRSQRSKSSSQERGIEMSKDELLDQQSGIIVLNVISGQLNKKARLEVLMDDGYWPCFSTARARSAHAQWEYVGEGFVKELDFGQVWLRLNEAEEEEKDDIIAEWKGETKKFLDDTLDKPFTFTLTDKDGDVKGTVTVEARYVPVPVTLEPRESINNQGILQIALLDGKDIRGVDRGGKSDPFVVFTLNGQKVYKSQTKKKTLTPEWNENFAVSVPSRVGADFFLEVYDWNQIEQSKLLGAGKIELADIEPFVGTERNISLTTDKHGDKGQVRLRLNFQPEIIAKARKNTSTFSTAGRVATTIGSMPVGAGKGVIHGVHSVFKRDNNKSANGGIEEQLLATEPAPGQASQPIGASEAVGVNGAAAFPSAGSSPTLEPNEPGSLKVTIMDAKDLTPPSGDVPRAYVVVRVGDKEQKTKHTAKSLTPEWNESFVFSAGPMTPKLFAWIHDHKTIGKDKIIATAEVDIWRHIQPSAAGTSSAEVFAELKDGSGQLRLRLEFDPDAGPARTLSPRKSVSSFDNRRTSFSSPSRFSLSRKRPGSEED